MLNNKTRWLDTEVLTAKELDFVRVYYIQEIREEKKIMEMLAISNRAWFYVLAKKAKEKVIAQRKRQKIANPDLPYIY